jgi:hypothetical protein
VLGVTLLLATHAKLSGNPLESRSVVRPNANSRRPLPSPLHPTSPHLTPEAHCERMIDVLPLARWGFGFSVGEATIMARSAVRGQ